MAHRPTRKARARKAPGPAKRRSRRRKRRFPWLPKFRRLIKLPKPSTRRRWWRRLRRLPHKVQLSIGIVVVAIVAIGINWTFHVIHKPSELFFPLSGTQYKTPTQTWRAYAPLFQRHSTAVLTPEMLAALAQIEGSGNPIVRTYWRWALSTNPFAVYRPASSAVGMYQLTNGTFVEARRYCIHDHKVVKDGPWHEMDSCWFNSLYTRVIPSHAVELTAAYLDHRVATSLSRRRITRASLSQKQDLAAVIHLCGATAGEAYAERGFRFRTGQRCGSHDPSVYLTKVQSMKRLFGGMERGE